jgi:hypothetical protein
MEQTSIPSSHTSPHFKLAAAALGTYSTVHNSKDGKWSTRIYLQAFIEQKDIKYSNHKPRIIYLQRITYIIPTDS